MYYGAVSPTETKKGNIFLVLKSCSTDAEHGTGSSIVGCYPSRLRFEKVLMM